ATHYRGSEITYRNISGCTYEIIVSQYFDCSGLITTPTTPGNLTFGPAASCTILQPTALTGWTLVSDEEVTPLENSLLIAGTNCSSSSSMIQGVRRLVFSREYDFCGNTCPVTVSLAGCCRSGLVTNLVNPQNTGHEVHMDMMAFGLSNQAPEWIDPSYTLIDLGLTTFTSLSAYDSDGDSLAYEFDTIYDSPGVPANFAPGYSVSNPISSSVFLGTQSGLLSAFPSFPIGDYALAVTVEEFRNGNLIGRYSRDMTVSVITGLTGADQNFFYQTNWFGNNYPPVNGTFVDSFTIETFVGNNLSIPFEIFSLNGPPETTAITWSQNLPGGVFYNYLTNQVNDTIIGLNPVVALDWTPTAPGRYSFVLKGTDLSHYVTSQNDRTFIIDVAPLPTCSLTVDIGLDSASFCAGDTIFSQVSGGPAPYTYLWSTAETGSKIAVFVSGTYILDVTDANNCTASDTIYVEVGDACVWPGDADNDGIANNFDLLALGLSYGFTGPVRDNASL
ncbi:MAG: hypothetical protein AAF206_32280, partial [Bacteroidota bacterium]